MNIKEMRRTKKRLYFLLHLLLPLVLLLMSPSCFSFCVQEARKTVLLPCPFGHQFYFLFFLVFPFVPFCFKTSPSHTSCQLGKRSNPLFPFECEHWHHLFSNITAVKQANAITNRVRFHPHTVSVYYSLQSASPSFTPIKHSGAIFSP